MKPSVIQPTPLEQLIREKIAPGHQGLLTREIIEAYQLRQLGTMLSYCAAHSPFYKQKLRGLAPEDLTSLADITKLPFTTAEDIQNHGPEMLCMRQDDIARIITMHSSGTTGPPKRLYFTDADLEATLNFFYLGMQAIAQKGWKAAILLPGSTPDSTGDLLARALIKFGVKPHIFGLVGEPEKIRPELAALQAEVIVGFPVQILALARLAQFHGTPLNKTRSVLLCSDYIPRSLTTQLKELLGCQIFSHYGTVETGLGGGVDCGAFCGLHLRESELLIEIIDPLTGVPVPTGEVGEIVVTTLTRKGMPLLRYKTGDQSRVLPGPCPCSSTITRLDRVLGRQSNLVSLTNGQTNTELSMQILDEALFSLPGLLDFTATVEEENNCDTLCLRLTTLPHQQQRLITQTTRRLKALPRLNAIHLQVTAQKHLTIAPAKRIIDDNRQDGP